MTDDGAPFRLGSTERRGKVLGLRPGQVGAVALGTAALLGGVAVGGVIGVALGLLAAAACLGASVGAVRGRGIDEWVPVVASFALTCRRGALCEGAVVVAAGETSPAALRWPDGTTSTVAHLEHRGLLALADEPRALGASFSAWLRSLSAPGAPRCTVTLLTASGPALAPRDAPWAMGGVEVRALVAVSSRIPVAVAAALGDAGVRGARQLDAAGLERLLSARVAPAAGDVLGTDLCAHWRHLEGPASVHAAFTVEEWPTGPVDEQLLAPLCISRDRRTVCVTVQAEELRRARGRTARQRTSAAADRELASGAGFLASAEGTLAAARDAERAAELAAGHGPLRLVVTVALDAADTLELEVAAARLEADAARCGLRLRRCDGDHRRGVLASVPGWTVP